jgi:tyrosyl-tRNA synthetase
MFERNETPEEMPEVEVASPGGTIAIARLLVAAGLAASNSEGSRLVRQGGVRLDGERVAPETRDVPAAPGTSVVLKVGKRRFARARFV